MRHAGADVVPGIRPVQRVHHGRAQIGFGRKTSRRLLGCLADHRESALYLATFSGLSAEQGEARIAADQTPSLTRQTGVFQASREVLACHRIALPVTAPRLVGRTAYSSSASRTRSSDGNCS